MACKYQNDMGNGIYNFYDPLTYAIQEIHSRIS